MKFLSWALEGAELLQPLLVMSLQGAVLIGAVLALRAVFARRMAPGVLYALWLLPAARLLIPGSIGSAFSFLNFNGRKIYTVLNWTHGMVSPL